MIRILCDIATGDDEKGACGLWDLAGILVDRVLEAENDDEAQDTVYKLLRLFAEGERDE